MMRCQAKTKNGERCRNQAREGEELCGIHAAPDAVRTAWGARGGRTSTRATVDASKPYTDLGPSEWTQWARAQCASALEAVRDGKADVRIAHAIAALVGQVLRATEQEELRHEVEALTAEVAELKARRENAA
jgi:hypothetical protein